MYVYHACMHVETGDGGDDDDDDGGGGSGSGDASDKSSFIAANQSSGSPTDNQADTQTTSQRFAGGLPVCLPVCLPSCLGPASPLKQEVSEKYQSRHLHHPLPTTTQAHNTTQYNTTQSAQ